MNKIAFLFFFIFIFSQETFFTNVPLAHANQTQKLIRLAEAGDIDAQMRLGYSYRSGKGAWKSLWRSALWFEKAAIQGSPEALYNLALLNSEEPTKINYVQAYAYITVAMALDNTLKYFEEKKEIAAKLTPNNFRQAQELAAEYYEKYSKNVDYEE